MKISEVFDSLTVAVRRKIWPDYHHVQCDVMSCKLYKYERNGEGVGSCYLYSPALSDLNGDDWERIR